MKKLVSKKKVFVCQCYLINGRNIKQDVAKICLFSLRSAKNVYKNHN